MASQCDRICECKGAAVVGEEERPRFEEDRDFLANEDISNSFRALPRAATPSGSHSALRAPSEHGAEDAELGCWVEVEGGALYENGW